jgi:cytoskeletal protein CcmA (bactofilin family)
MMSLFRDKNDKKQVTSMASDKDAISSIIGGDMTISGDVSFKGKVRVDGKVEGDIKGEYLILSEAGGVTGDIEAGVFICHGKVDGNVSANKLFVKRTAVIHGRVDTTELSIEGGASLKGEVVARCQDLQAIEGSFLHQDHHQEHQHIELKSADERIHKPDEKTRPVDKMLFINEETA